MANLNLTGASRLDDVVVPSGEEGLHASIQQRVFSQIREMVEDGRIKPGERLLEVHVAKAFGVSRSPARRALEDLCEAKVVRAGPGRGYVVPGGRSDRGPAELATIESTAVEPSARWRQVYAEVEHQICIGVVTDSLRITEERVADHFNVSRTVARDALARLQAVGLVFKDRQGRWLAEQLTSDRLRSLYELRWLLEPQALLQSVATMDRERLIQSRRNHLAALDDIPRLGSTTHIDLEQELHVELLAGCQNKEILRVLERTHTLLVSNPHRLTFQVESPREHMRSSLTQHLEVLDLVIAGKLSAAGKAMHRHLAESCGFWIDNWERVLAEPIAPLPSYLTPVDLQA